jgi:hypothetical protein
METRVLDQSVIARFRETLEGIPKDVRNVALIGGGGGMNCLEQQKMKSHQK